MNWGLKDYSTDDHSYASGCLAELQECEKVSKGPFFVVSKIGESGYWLHDTSFSDI